MKINKFLSAAALGLLLTTAGTAQAADYKIDQTHTFIEFKVSHLGYSWLNGRFDDFEGTFTFDPSAGPEAQKINITIDTTSINSNHAERDKHLRGDDFLNVDKFPTATFKSTGFEGDEKGGVMKGELTLMGVTKPIEIAVKKIGEGKDPWGGYRAGFEGTTSFKRADFGNDYNLGPTAETVYMELFVEGIRQ